MGDGLNTPGEAGPRLLDQLAIDEMRRGLEEREREVQRRENEVAARLEAREDVSGVIGRMEETIRDKNTAISYLKESLVAFSGENDTLKSEVNSLRARMEAREERLKSIYLSLDKANKYNRKLMEEREVLCASARRLERELAQAKQLAAAVQRDLRQTLNERAVIERRAKDAEAELKRLKLKMNLGGLR